MKKYIRLLVNEELINVYSRNLIREGYEDHKDTKMHSSCISPKKIAMDMNNELLRLNTSGKGKGKRGLKKTIYTGKQIKKFLEFGKEYNVYSKELADKGMYTYIYGTFNKDEGFKPSKYGENSGFKASDELPIKPFELSITNTPIGELNVELFKQQITAKPKTIFDRNPKMEKSDKEGLRFTVNTGLPAINGVIWDDGENKFRYLNTCPGAGECLTYCYARKGFYLMNSGKVIKLTQRLNLLWNNPDIYEKMAKSELFAKASKLKIKGEIYDTDVPKLLIRWNDAGDFFSERYFRIAERITNQLLESGYNVRSYAYTKQAKFVLLGSDKFVMNFSMGSKPSELEKLDLSKVKYSDVVAKIDIVDNPKFKDLFVMDDKKKKKDGDVSVFKDLFSKGVNPETGKAKKWDFNPDTGLPNFIPGGAEKLKQRISTIYDVPIERLKYQFELPDNEDEKFKYDVIVLPTGDSDIGAQRLDVHKTFLLIH